jgi:hypothetical protein
LRLCKRLTNDLLDTVESSAARITFRLQRLQLTDTLIYFTIKLFLGKRLPENASFQRKDNIFPCNVTAQAGGTVNFSLCNSFLTDIFGSLPHYAVSVIQGIRQSLIP